MADAIARAKDCLPTLTEVVDWSALPVPVAAVEQVGASTPHRPAAETDLSAEVLFEIENRIHAQFESRLREALAPALARAADGLIRDARNELSAALRDLVEEAVNRAIERRTRG